MNSTKKILLAFFTIFSLFISCNTNAEEGIFYQIINSTKNTQIKINQYLGVYENNHYVISQGKLYKISNNNYFEISGVYDDGIIINGYLKDENIFFICQEKKTSLTIIRKYNIDSRTIDSSFSSNGSFRMIFENGYALGEQGLYFIKETEASLIEDTPIPKTIKKFFISKDAIVLSTEASVFIIDKNGDIKITLNKSSVSLSGFQKLSDNSYLVFIDKNIYKVDDTTDSNNPFTTPLVTLSSSWDTRSFGYNTAIQGNKILIKASSSFLLIDDYNSETYTIKSNGLDYLNNLTQISPIYISSYNDKILLATNQNGIYIIDVNSNTKQQIF